MSKPTDKLIPFMNRNRFNVWFPEIPYAISLDGSFVVSLSFDEETPDHVNIQTYDKVRQYPRKEMERLSVWKVELVA